MKKILLGLWISSCLLAAQSYGQESKENGEKESSSSKINESASQEEKTGKNEIKINLFYTVFSTAEVTYERLFTDNSAVGLAAAYCFPNDGPGSLDYNWSVNPYYRLYFGKKQASGFFIEANSAIYQSHYVAYRVERGLWDYYDSKVEEDLAFGLGVATGAKFISLKGLVGEVYAGLGRGFNIKELYPRFGILIGKRF